jgi:hypothetical protein
MSITMIATELKFGRKNTLFSAKGHENDAKCFAPQIQ